jgi:predicted dehydrogenase
MARSMAADMAVIPGCRIAAVTSRTERSSTAFAADFSAKAYPKLDAMLSSGDIDIVYVNSTNQAHSSQVKEALEAGKPVLCEKPFTLNAPQLAGLVALARSKNLFLMEAMWVRYLPAVVKLRQLLTDGIIGELQWMQAGFHANPAKDPKNRFYDPALGGGALLDLGIYPISFASMVFGEPARIVSSASLAPTGVDERFAAIFDYASGAHASLSAGFNGFFKDEIVLLGSTGQVRAIRSAGWKVDRLIVERNGQVEDLQFLVDGRGYGYQAAEVLRCLEAGETESPVMPLDESLAIMKTLGQLRAQWGMVYPGE